MIHLCARLCLHSLLSPSRVPRITSRVPQITLSRSSVLELCTGCFAYCIHDARERLVLCASARAYWWHCSPRCLVVASRCGAHMCVRIAPGSRLVRDCSPANNKASSLTDKCINLLPCLHIVPHLATKACILRVSCVCLTDVLRASQTKKHGQSRREGRVDLGPIINSTSLPLYQKGRTPIPPASD